MDSTPATVAHILRRTGGVPTPELIDHWAGRSVTDLLEHAMSTRQAEAPAELDDDSWEGLEEVGGWLLAQIRNPEPSVHERLVWIWHDHFPVSLEKANPALVWRNHRMLRRHALGNFRELVRAISTDPAMLRYLDGAESVADAPNENFARELMELFTIGPEHFTEADVRNAALALTGWGIDDDGNSYLDDEFRHHGATTVLGTTGTLGVDDIVDIVCDHPACAPFIARKLHVWFVGTEPDTDRLDELAGVFRDADLEIEPLVREILFHPSFLEHQGNRFRQPLEWLAAAWNATDFDDEGSRWVAGQLGQTPWEPPNVAGWPDGPRWVAADQQLRRTELATWFAPGDLELDRDDPVGDVLRRAGLYDVSDETRATLQRTADRTQDGSWEHSSLLMSLVLMTPEFARA